MSMDAIWIINNWHKISAVLLSLAVFLVSPVVVIRWLRTRNELLEMQTYVKKNQLVREEMAKINAMLNEHAERIRTLELQLHQERLINAELKAENDRLRAINRRLQEKLDEVDDWEL